jgi:neural Wiskott-Aldrich syndrome protein
MPHRVEVRVARADVANVGTGMSGAPARHDVRVTKAMSVRLRAPEGGFYIETGSPETQWIENQLGVLTDDYASWRWTVTPSRRGKSRLQLIVSARTVGPDGLAAETALPDQVIDVSVSVNYARLLKSWSGWAAAAIVGGLLAKFGEQFLGFFG